FDCALVDERSDLRVVLEPVADLHAGSDFRETLREAIVDAALNEYAVRAYAGLPRVSILGGDGARDRGLDIGIVEHDKRRVAAELERELLQRGCALFHQRLADGRGAGEAQLTHEQVARELRADRRGDR